MAIFSESDIIYLHLRGFVVTNDLDTRYLDDSTTDTLLVWDLEVTDRLIFSTDFSLT